MMPTPHIRAVVHIIVCVVLVGLWQPSYGATLDFESLSDGDAVTNQFIGEGVTFSNASILTAGVSLNEFEFPPKSGNMQALKTHIQHTGSIGIPY